MLPLILPDADVWMRAFSRRAPDPLVVHRFGILVRARRVVLMGSVRQVVLAQAGDERQFGRLAWILSGWPDLPLKVADHERGAAVMRQLGPMGVTIGPSQAVMWAVAERLGALVWSNARSWQALVPHGCPWWRSAGTGEAPASMRQSAADSQGGS
jgi:hypothetical protein